MALPYSKPFLSQQGLQNQQIGAIVPAGKVWVVRCVTAFAGVSGLGGNVHFRNATHGWTFAATDFSGSVAISYVVELHVVLEEGEELAINAGAGPVDVFAGGYELSS